MNPHTTYWIKHLKKHQEYGHLRFKKLDKGFYGYLPFDFDETLLDVVDLETFIKNEDNRIPLFIGSSLTGINPRLNDFPDFFKEDKIIGVLGISVLNGTHYGLGIYKILAGTTLSIGNEIVFFKNEK
jgi:hypothetical protein